MNPFDFRQYSDMDHRPITEQQLQEHLRRQLRHLHNSARLFDEGDEDEAIRLGTTVRVLVHRTKNSHSLLGQLNLRDSISWFDTCRYRADINAAQQALLNELHLGSGMKIAATNPLEVGLVSTGMSTEGVPMFVAPLESAAIQHSSLDKWWRGAGIETSTGATFSRCDLVSAMANKDGGAHVDPNVPGEYDDFTSDFMGVQFAFGDVDLTIGGEPAGGWSTYSGNIAAASMRQIAWEVEATLYGLNMPWLRGQPTGNAPMRSQSHYGPSAIIYGTPEE